MRQRWLGTTVAAAAGPPSPGPTYQLCYPPGWNLVGGPAGFPVPLWMWDPTAGQYKVLPAGSRFPLGPFPGESNGQGAWAYFAQTTAVTFLGVQASEAPLPVGVRAGQWQQIGNPSAVGSAVVCGSGTDAFTYDPVAGAYSQATVLGEGQGAWVYSPTGGTVTFLLAGRTCPPS